MSDLIHSLPLLTLAFFACRPSTVDINGVWHGPNQTPDSASVWLALEETNGKSKGYLTAHNGSIVLAVTATLSAPNHVSLVPSKVLRGGRDHLRATYKGTICGDQISATVSYEFGTYTLCLHKATAITIRESNAWHQAQRANRMLQGHVVDSLSLVLQDLSHSSADEIFPGMNPWRSIELSDTIPMGYRRPQHSSHLRFGFLSIAEDCLLVATTTGVPSSPPRELSLDALRSTLAHSKTPPTAGIMIVDENNNRDFTDDPVHEWTSLDSAASPFMPNAPILDTICLTTDTVVLSFKYNPVRMSLQVRRLDALTGTIIVHGKELPIALWDYAGFGTYNFDRSPVRIVIDIDRDGRFSGIHGSKELFSPWCPILLPKLTIALDAISPSGSTLYARSITFEKNEMHDIWPGNQAPSFKTKVGDAQRSVTLTDFAGRYLVMDFCGNGCNSCEDPTRSETLQIDCVREVLSQRLGQTQVIHVWRGDPKETENRRMIVFEPNRAEKGLFSLFRVFKIPSLIIINPAGTIVASGRGGMGTAERLQEVWLHEKGVEVSFKEMSQMLMSCSQE